VITHEVEGSAWQLRSPQRAPILHQLAALATGGQPQLDASPACIASLAPLSNTHVLRSWNRNRPIGARVMRVTLNPSDPLKVATFTPFLSGGVPNDKGSPNGPVPLPERSQGYNGEAGAVWAGRQRRRVFPRCAARPAQTLVLQGSFPQPCAC